MDLIDLRNNLIAMTPDKMQKDLFIYIKQEIPHILLNYNKKQLFEESIGSDGINLGYYKSSILQTDDRKKPGQAFKMIETGDFLNKMVVKVDRRGNSILITSETAKLDDMLNNKAYVTINFFGLTKDNINDLIKEWINPFIVSWTKKNLGI